MEVKRLLCSLLHPGVEQFAIFFFFFVSPSPENENKNKQKKREKQLSFKASLREDRNLKNNFHILITISTVGSTIDHWRFNLPFSLWFAFFFALCNGPPFSRTRTSQYYTTRSVPRTWWPRRRWKGRDQGAAMPVRGSTQSSPSTSRRRLRAARLWSEICGGKSKATKRVAWP